MAVLSRQASQSQPMAALSKPMAVLSRLAIFEQGCGGAWKRPPPRFQLRRARSDIAPHKQFINGRTLLFYQGTLEQRKFIKANGRFMKANCRFIKAGPDGRFAKGSPMTTLSRVASHDGRFMKADGRFGQPQWPLYQQWPFY